MNGWSKYGGEYKINEAPAEVDEYFVWMGIFVRQWGHFLLDCVNRLWCINDNMYKDLKTTNNYAKMKGVTTECVRQWALQGKIKSVKIDGVRFIKLM